MVALRVDELPDGPRVSSSRKSCVGCGDPLWLPIMLVEAARSTRLVCRGCAECERRREDGKPQQDRFLAAIELLEHIEHEEDSVA